MLFLFFRSKADTNMKIIYALCGLMLVCIVESKTNFTKNEFLEGINISITRTKIIIFFGIAKKIRML